jgi:pyridoxine 4-dehydrogenase
MAASMTPAAAAGTLMLGDLPVNRLGFGAMRVTGGPGAEQAAPPES